MAEPDPRHQLAAYLVIQSGLLTLQESGINRFALRRLLDAAIAITAPNDGTEGYREALMLGIAALQAADDLPALNVHLLDEVIELQRRLEGIE